MAAPDIGFQGAVLVAALLTGMSVLVLRRPSDTSRLTDTRPTALRAVPARPRRPPTRAVCLVAGVGVAVLVTGRWGILLGLGVALAGPPLLGRLESREQRAVREQLAADLPLLLELLSACLAGGAALSQAADAVAIAVPGPAGRRLAAVASALAVGMPPAHAWRLLAGPTSATPEQDPLAPAARVLARAADGGAPVASAVSRLAAEARADARLRGEQAARRAGVLAVAPLGLCFLPAFVLLGVVPVVAGMVGPMLTSF